MEKNLDHEVVLVDIIYSTQAMVAATPTSTSTQESKTRSSIAKGLDISPDLHQSQIGINHNQAYVGTFTLFAVNNTETQLTITYVRTNLKVKKTSEED
ncbi:hypothetical protein FQR65_LT01967 [Abscondita terminalis]|nr:hypothetical protein FQR65_LT01967 [Abscondita terminalis]